MGPATAEGIEVDPAPGEGVEEDPHLNGSRLRLNVDPGGSGSATLTTTFSNAYLSLSHKNSKFSNLNLSGV